MCIIFDCYCVPSPDFLEPAGGGEEGGEQVREGGEEVKVKVKMRHKVSVLRPELVVNFLK